MFIPPVRYLLRGINFEPSAFDKKSFHATVFMMPLFVPSDHLTLNFGDRVRDKQNRSSWNMDMPDLITELSKALKLKAVPFLLSFESLHDFIEMAQRRLREVVGPNSLRNPHTLQAIAYALAYVGEFREAWGALDELQQHLDLRVPWQQAMAGRAEILASELRDDPAAAKHRLETWEVETVKILGLETFREDSG